MRFVLVVCGVASACSPGAPDGGARGGLGVAVPACSSRVGDVLCRGVACTADSECGALARTCEESLGTYPTEFTAVGCLAGECHYRTRSGGCPDLTPCASCATNPSCGDRDAGACADCAIGVNAAQLAPVQSCVCSGCAACAGSKLCGGSSGHSDACAACAAQALAGSGCESARASCSGDCASLARRILTCLR